MATESSIGIIGGADGPTAILVSDGGSITDLFYAGFAAGVVTAAVVIGIAVVIAYFVHKKRKK